MQETVLVSADKPLDFVVDRSGGELTLHATPRLIKEKDRFGNVYPIGRLGITQSNAPEDVITRKFGPFGAIAAAGKQTWSIIDQSMSFIGRVLIGRASTEEIGGVVRIAQLSGQAASMGFMVLMGWAAAISVSIGMVNLFPIPMLDGGHLLFYAFEALRGRPLSERVQEVGFRIGFAIIVLLMIFTVYNDLPHLWAS
jgi:regulator of sigma E protease